VGDAFAGHLQDRQIIGGELAVLQRADVQDADHAVSHDEWDTGHRAQTLAQQRVQHGGGMDLVEHRRTTRRGDPSGEPAADGHSIALPRRFFDALGGERLQLGAGRVRHQHDRRVHVEDLPDDVQHAQDGLLGMGAGQVDIGDRLHRAAVPVPLTRPSHACTLRCAEPAWDARADGG
jgi:hypothetical protein